MLIAFRFAPRQRDILPFALFAASLVFLLAIEVAAADGGPWRFDRAVDAPERLTLDFSHRTRIGHLEDQFRSGLEGNDTVFSFRSQLHARLQALDWLTLGGEFIDSRVALDSDSTPRSTALINTTELLQAYAELAGPLGAVDARLRGGRITMDVGSRRLVARNRFRNTINGFTGIDASIRTKNELDLRAFAVLPVQRRPFRPQDLERPQTQIDKEDFNVVFVGLFGTGRLPTGDQLELFSFGLREEDSGGRPTRNRKLWTGGWRLLRAPKAGRFDFQLESVLQAGESRLISAGSEDLDHLAHFHHAELGYRFDAPWSPRVVAQFDYASGDDDPTDDENNRFDTLFGARRFDYGPTGIFGPFIRANLITPGLRLQVKPHARVTGFTSVRAFWVAEKKDAVLAMRLQDPRGNSGRYVGSQVEARLRFQILPGNLGLELGFAHLFTDEFREEVPTNNGQGDATYVYAQTVVSF
jgi:hypothetical protein